MQMGGGGFFVNKIPASKEEWVEYDFDTSLTLDIPGDWNSQSDRLSFYEGTVWMRNKFKASPQAGKRYILYFGAVNYEPHVYLNDKKLGMHKGGFTPPFQFEVAGKLLNGENTVIEKRTIPVSPMKFLP